MSVDDSLAVDMQELENEKPLPTAASSLTYESLSTPRSIRLLKLPDKQNSSPVLGSEISVTMHTCSLDTAPAFNALSYTWGKPYREPFGDDPELPPEFIQIINCNGVDIKITQNLFDALSSFRALGVTGNLWVDALCINQSNIDERSSQVLLMGDVYSQAETVLVWLGHRQAGIEEFHWATTEFLDLVQSPDDPTLVRPPFSATNMIDKQFWESHGIEYPLPKLLKLLHFYQSCRWFSRMWVFQEVALAKNVRLFCGNKEISFLRTMLFAMLMRRLGWLDGVVSMAGLPKGQSREWFREIIIIFIATKGHLDYAHDGVVWNEDAVHTGIPILYGLLFLCRIYACFDSRDKIYAILGFIDRTSNTLSIANQLQPSYQKEANTVFTNTMALFLNHMDTLDLLGDTRRTPEVPHSLNLPSWVINFSSSKQATPIVLVDKPVDAAFCPSSNYPKFKVHGNILHCSGARFDGVANILHMRLEESFNFGIDGGRLLIQFFQFYLNLPYSILGISRLILLCRTMILNLSHPQGNAFGVSKDLGYEADAFMKSRVAILLAYLMIGNIGSDDFDRVQKGFETSKCPADRRIFQFFIDRKLYNGRGSDGKVRSGLTKEQHTREINALDKACHIYNELVVPGVHRRRLFTTDRGLLGSGIETLQKGDEVWLLCNARVPMILRRTAISGEYTLIGECYVYGFMNGEMLHDELHVKENIHPIKIV